MKRLAALVLVAALSACGYSEQQYRTDDGVCMKRNEDTVFGLPYVTSKYIVEDDDCEIPEDAR